MLLTIKLEKWEQYLYSDLRTVFSLWPSSSPSSLPQGLICILDFAKLIEAGFIISRHRKENGSRFRNRKSGSSIYIRDSVWENPPYIPRQKKREIFHRRKNLFGRRHSSPAGGFVFEILAVCSGCRSCPLFQDSVASLAHGPAVIAMSYSIRTVIQLSKSFWEKASSLSI